MTSYKAHPAANLFPLMTPAELTELTTDISANGQRESIKLYEGKILDGRNRYAACVILGIEPRVENYDGDEPYAYVISLNAKRRNLNESQLGMIAVAAKPKLEEEARRRQAEHRGTAPGKPAETLSDHGREVFTGHSGKASNAAGAMFGVSGKTVERAEKVINSGVPELVAMVREGKVSARAAALVATLPPDEQREVISRGPTHVRSKSQSVERAARFQVRVKGRSAGSGIHVSKKQFAKLRDAAKALRKLCADGCEHWKVGSIRKLATEIVDMLDGLTERKG